MKRGVLTLVLAFFIGCFVGYGIANMIPRPQTQSKNSIGLYQFAGLSPAVAGTARKLYRLDTSTGYICVFTIDDSGDLGDTTSCAH